MRNHLGEKSQSTYAGWRAAIQAEAKAVGLGAGHFAGDKDICSFSADDPTSGKRIDLGQWDGAEGFVSKREWIDRAIQQARQPAQAPMPPMPSTPGTRTIDGGRGGRR